MSTVADFEFEALARRVAVLETRGDVLTEGVADLEERLRGLSGEKNASKRLEKLMAQLGVETYGEVRTAINELQQHQTTESTKQLKDRAEFLAHKLEEAQAVNDKQDIDNAFLRADLERMRAEIERLEARQLPDGAEWPVDADGVRIEVGDRMRYGETGIPHRINGFALVPTYADNNGCTSIICGSLIYWHHVQPEPAEQPETEDSWERLEEDAMKDSCVYLNGEERIRCTECQYHLLDGLECYQQKNLDLVRRAKALAGVE